MRFTLTEIVGHLDDFMGEYAPEEGLKCFRDYLIDLAFPHHREEARDPAPDLW